MHTPVSDDLSQRLADTPDKDLHTVYSNAGYWNDALDTTLSMLIDSQPGDTDLRRKHANQINLPKAADYDIKHIFED